MRTLQLPSLRSRSVVYSFLAWCGMLRSAWGQCYLIPMHPKRKADRGGTAPSWPGTAQLGRAVAVQRDAKISPTVGSNPWRHALSQSSVMAYNGSLQLLVLVIQRKGRAGTIWGQRRRRSCHNETAKCNHKQPVGPQLQIFPQGCLLKPSL